MKNLKYFIILLFISYSNLNYSMENDSFLIVEKDETCITEKQYELRVHRQLKELIDNIKDNKCYKKNEEKNIVYLKELEGFLKKQNIIINFEILWSAIHDGLDDVLKILIRYAKEQGFDFNQKDEKTYGPTLLYLAVCFHRKEAVKLLLGEKSDPSIKTNAGKNSFDIAKENLAFAQERKQQGVSDTWSCYPDTLEIYKLLESALKEINGV